MDPFLYKDWLDSFKREVAEELDRMRRAPAPAAAATPAPTGKAAAAELREWWSKDMDPAPLPEESLSTLQTNRELELSRQEARALQAEVETLRASQGSGALEAKERLETLSLEKSRLEEQLASARRENRQLGLLKDLKGTMDEELGGLRVRMSAVRGEYEGRLRLLGDRIGELERREKASAAELAAERSARLEAEKALEEHRRRLAETDALRAELGALRSALDAKLEAAAEFLEAKIRSVQDQSHGHAQQVREIVEALRRLRETA